MITNRYKKFVSTNLQEKFNRADLSQRIISRLGRHFHGTFRHRLMFLHIPKCGGTSIVDALGACYGPYAIDPSRFYLDAEAVFKTARQFDQHFQQVSETLLLYTMAQKQYRFITGHFFFSEKAYQQFGEQWKTITILRDPVSRWFSQYFYNRYKQKQHCKTDAELDTYIESEKGAGSGRTLMNVLEGSGKDWECDPQQGVSRAIENLKKISLVGFLEHLEEFQTGFRERFGATLKVGTFNKNPAPSDRRNEHMTQEVIEKVQHICRYDIQIYQHALSNFIRTPSAAK